MNIKKNIKFIALDIDGTIMDRNFHISNRVKTAINSASKKGIKVVLATGRMYIATLPIAKMLQLDTPIIAYHGSLVKDEQKEYIHHTIDRETALKLASDLRGFNMQVNVCVNEELFSEKETPQLIKYAKERNLDYKIVKSFENIKDFCPTKFTAIKETSEFVSEVTDFLQEKYSDKLYIKKSFPTYCEIINNKANKANAILYLANLWNIDSSEILAAGDQDNDREMLKIAGFSVAMGNAVDEIKAIADYVTDSVDNDGIAKVIENFLL
ncbi:MAG: HAD family hydrolase [Candidatus Gastranaerophilaceae bacterium]|jgi:hypothetical protein